MTASNSGIAAGQIPSYNETSFSASKKISGKVLTAREMIQSDDEMRLSKLGYRQVPEK